MDQDDAPEADHITAEDNTQPNDDSRNHTEALDEVKTQTKDEAAPSAKPLSKEKAALKAELLYRINNHAQIKAEEAEARVNVRDDEGEVIYTFHRRKIVRISENLVVKKADDIPAHEAPTLRFVAENTTIPVPKVHDARLEDGKVVGIVMDYMPGKPLDDIWNPLSPDQKQSIAEQLRGYLSQLRNLKGDYIGAIGRGTVSMGKFGPIYGGPFDTEKEFNQWILSDLHSSISAPLKNYAEHALVDGHEIIFTHADFSPRNILVNENSNYRVTAILDWEFAGWYPEWWEHFRAYKSFHKGKDWTDYLCYILPPQYEREFIGMSYVSTYCSS
jgi:serine/threonine protein kinase